MKTTKYEIELPTVPDGWELVGFTTPNPGDMYLKDLGGMHWALWTHDRAIDSFYHVASKKQSPAEWANAQPLLSVVAKVCRGEVVIYSNGQHCLKDGSGRPCWIHAEPCPEEFSGKTIKPDNGKWVDAT